MKKLIRCILFLVVTYLVLACSSTWDEQNQYFIAIKGILAEKDWTDETSYHGDEVEYDKDHARLSVVHGQGLIIESDPPENADYNEPYVPIIINIPPLEKGAVYLVKFTLDAPTAGEIRLDLCNWVDTGATSKKVVKVGAGVNDYLIEFDKYPIACKNDAKLLYQCGKMPGKHVIKKVQVYRYR